MAAVLCGCETWSLTLMEEHRLGRDEVKRDWGRMHDVEPHKLNSLPSIIRMNNSSRMRLAGHVVRLGEKSNAYRILV
jgi:hypothetical protein